MKKKLVIFYSVFFIFLTGVIFFTPVVSVLHIRNRKNPKEFYYSAAAYRNGFVISYTHSVNKGRVHDYYKCLRGNTILLDKTLFVSYGAGIPEPEETPGAHFTVTDSGYEITNLNRHLSTLTMAVGIVANHSISCDISNDFTDTVKESFLTDYFEPQTSLILDIKKVCLLNFLLHKF